MRYAARRGSASLPSGAALGDVQGSPESPGGSLCAWLKDEMWSVESYLYGRNGFRPWAKNYTIDFKYLECVFCVLFLDECLKIILPISNNHTTNLQISVMRELCFVSASLPKVRASIWEIILLISE